MIRCPWVNSDCDVGMAERIYLDWNATAPLRPEARQAMLAALDVVGNPSSVHNEGRRAWHLVETARGQVAALLGAESRNVVFTSGGTEANVLALTPEIEIAGRKPCDRLLMSAVEHASVRSGGRFPRPLIEDVPVTVDGIVDLEALERRLGELRASGKAPLVSLMHANNETGVMQPVAAAAAMIHAAGGLLHVDAVQTAGRIPCDIRTLGADLLTVSGHKMGAPKGVGALVKASEALHFADPLIRGGGQERGARAGTENVAAIAGFGAAAAAAAASMTVAAAKVAGLRGRLESGLRAIRADTVVFGSAAERLPNTTLFAVPGCRAETALIALDLEGVAVSSGSACSSGKVAASHVLDAMGVPPALAEGAIRVSLGCNSAESDVDGFLEAWRKLVSRLSTREKRGLAA
jgi:cysteine desulfurase